MEAFKENILFHPHQTPSASLKKNQSSQLSHIKKNTILASHTKKNISKVNTKSTVKNRRALGDISNQQSSFKLPSSSISNEKINKKHVNSKKLNFSDQLSSGQLKTLAPTQENNILETKDDFNDEIEFAFGGLPNNINDDFFIGLDKELNNDHLNTKNTDYLSLYSEQSFDIDPIEKELSLDSPTPCFTLDYESIPLPDNLSIPIQIGDNDDEDVDTFHDYNIKLAPTSPVLLTFEKDSDNESLSPGFLNSFTSKLRLFNDVEEEK